MTDASSSPQRDFFAKAMDAATSIVKSILHPEDESPTVSKKHNRRSQRAMTTTSTQAVATTRSDTPAKVGTSHRSVYRPDGTRTVYENGQQKIYNAKGEMTYCGPDTTVNEYYSSVDRRNGYGSTPYTGTYGGSGSSYLYGDDKDYPRWDSTKDTKENQRILAEYREKKEKERKREKLRKKKDSPTLLADIVRELKIENKDKLEPGQELKMHLEWQKYLAHFRAIRVPRVKAIIQRVNTSQGRNIVRLCDSCAGCLLIPTVRENGLICGASDCCNCQGSGYQIPTIRVD